MSYELTNGARGGRDWSIGAAVDVPGAAKSKPKIELWTPVQTKGLADLVDNEVNNNVALSTRRRDAGTLREEDEKAFVAFARNWRAWKNRDLKSGAAVDELKKWRIANAQWTQKLSENSRTPATGLVITSIRVTAVRGRPRWQWLAGLAAAFGLGCLVSRKG